MVIESRNPRAISLRADIERDEVAGVWFGTLSVCIGDNWYESRESELLNNSFVNIASWLKREPDAELFEAIAQFSSRQALIAALHATSNYSFAEKPIVRPELQLWLGQALEAPFGLELGPEAAVLIVRNGNVVRACCGSIRDGEPFATLENVSESRFSFEELRGTVRDFLSGVPPLSGISLLE